MKILPEHYNDIKEAFKLMLSNMKISMVDLQNKYVYDHIGKDHQMRCRWDVLYHCNRDLLGGNYICDVLYKYLNDNHIDSALKKIVQELSAE